jgi:hypothetical protein
MATVNPLGNGSAGDAVLDGTSDVPWAVRSGPDYLMTRDAHLTSLLIEEGVTVDVHPSAGHVNLFCQGTIVNKGIMFGHFKHVGELQNVGRIAPQSMRQFN